jgi:glycosyltransferase involved in cell wall biosynthesis
MKHIVQIVADGDAGGGTTFVLGLISDMSKLDYRISLITAPDSYAYRQAVSAGIFVQGFDLFTSRLDLRLSGRLAELLASLSPDLVHVHGARAAHPFTYGALYETRFPVVYTVHGYHFLKKGCIGRLAGLMAERRIAHRVNHICFVSNGDLRIATSCSILGSTASSVIYNGIDLSDVRSVKSRGPQYDLCFAGRMVPQKNPLFAIDVIKALRDDSITLLMIGGGDLYDRAVSYASKQGVSNLIKFCGALSRQETLESIAQCRALLFPSLWEGLPLTPMEAMALGVSVVASNIPGTNEIISHSECGVLIDDFEPLSYASEIRSLLRDEQKLHRVAHAGRRRIEDNFRREVCSEKYLDLYNQTLRYTSQ